MSTPTPATTPVTAVVPSTSAAAASGTGTTEGDGQGITSLPPIGGAAAAVGVAADTSTRQERKLFVGGLPIGCEQGQLDAYFSQYGDIEDSVVMTDRITGRTRGFGFVTYTTLQAVEVCLASGPHVLLDKSIDVKRAIEGGGGVRLDEFFSRYGNIIDSVVMKDRVTGKPRGFAYVTYSTPQEAQRAINAGHANMIDGKWVDVKIATRGSISHSRNNATTSSSPSSSSYHAYQQPSPSPHHHQMVGGGPFSPTPPPGQPQRVYGGDGGHNNSSSDDPCKVFIGGVPTSIQT
ncbi:hypothetical protein FOL47_010476, partial [Perkinsus chesapeaki]